MSEHEFPKTGAASDEGAPPAGAGDWAGAQDALPSGDAAEQAAKSDGLGGCLAMLFMMLLFMLASRCGGPTGNETAGVAPVPTSVDNLHIVAGSGFFSFEPILKRWGQQNGVDVQINYMGSLDIMMKLKNGAPDADAIWEGDSLWTTLGDAQQVVKDGQSIMCSPIVLGVKTSLARQLGWAGRMDVTMAEILAEVQKRDLRLLMTSASQSNSGAAAYFGFLYAFAGQPEVLKMEHLESPAVQESVKSLLGAIDRSSESSGWLRDFFRDHYADYDAMFNYESHILELNRQLVAAGNEPLYLIYPAEGLGMSDFPFSFVRRSDGSNAYKEQWFRSLRDYLRSEPIQRELAAKGRRTGPLCDQVDPEIFKPEWGADAGHTIGSIKWPAEEVIWQALNRYQTDFRKPSLTVYALDFSGSMEGVGERQVKDAMNLLLDQRQAATVLLQASSGDVTIVLPFSGTIHNADSVADWTVEGNDPVKMLALRDRIASEDTAGNTDIYGPVALALQLLAIEGVEGRLPAVILLTDGQSNQGAIADVELARAATGLASVPVFGITFGDADPAQLEALAKLTGGRVFDGTKDLVGAFRKAKGQN
jgi:Ca-activated chloride channel family protein